MPPSTLSHAPRYIQIRESIRERIQDGVYAAGEKIPTESEFESEFGVSRITVINAIKELVNDGLLTRQRGRGTFIRETRDQPVANRMVAILMRTRGHMFGDLSRLLVAGFQRRGFYPTLFDLPSAPGEPFPEHVQQFLDQGVEALVVEGVRSLPYEKLAQHADGWRRAVLMYRDETEGAFPGAARVTTNASAGVGLVLNHLLARGHRRIVHVSHLDDPTSPHIDGQIIAACEAACREHSLANEIQFRTQVLNPTNPESIEAMRQVLAAADRPTAVFGQDFRTKKVYELAVAGGLRVPDDLELIGWGNTPWSEALPVPMTSVDLCLEPLAERVVEAALSSAAARQNPSVLIDPKLVVRESSPAISFTR